MTVLEQVSHETMVFMRGRYRLDEIGNGKDDLCKAKRCSQENGSMICKECKEFPCIKATAADWRSMIHTDVHYADEITWGILPYVPMQYEELD